MLPINPLEELAFSVGTSSKEYDIIAIGEITQIGDRKQISVEIKSLFTSGDYSFSAGNSMSPKAYINKILKMMEAKAPVQLVIAGENADVNMLCSIGSFKYSMAFGEVGDYYYSLSLKEFRQYKLKKVVVKGSGISSSAQRSEASSNGYITGGNDNAFTAAKKATGSGDNAKAVVAANGVSPLGRLPSGNTIKELPAASKPLSQDYYKKHLAVMEKRFH